MEENVSIATNATVENFDFADPWVILRAVILALLILVTIIGNSFVIAVILVERSLQSVANYLIVSLAVADLMVACLAMPLGAVYEINSRWSLGPELCDIWTSSDVLCCTASILHLVAIAVDRYWAVTDLNYIQGRSPKKIGFLIAMVWIVSLGISLAPQFGWKDPNYLERIADGECLVSQDPAYQIIATCATFYLPCLLILFLYWRIFQTARKRIRKRPGTIVQPSRERRGILRLVTRSRQREESTAFTITRSTPDHSSISPEKSSSYNDGNVAQSAVVNVTPVTTSTTANSSNSTGQPTSSSTATTTATTGATTTATTAGVITTTTTTPATTTMTTSTSRPSSASTSTTVRQATSTKRSRETIESKREKKAAKTLAIITGAFVACWLPFFVLTLLRVICYWCQIPDVVYNVFLWLGYFNSTLNPVIYTIFSPEFRQGFKRMLCGSSRVTR
ncbi:5-hydroxytryptamine receptor 2A isoform X1 [Vespa velutina]|uniref:5-hydroxytryptamine receptor 2A isoform X1 n=1 Tax=Vespa velutina TaxID=202808 RepID=UPI001FB3E864|nr:5-hydroxytryptamine receptor 2A isoform X1 [Vespa velutina]XP_047353442.1 5-hydroxytryptamine receptor 2A isoform X1 [Vespa velutina]XP_047353443.1 5-hydroxytryptamine receptor 2A isoform X1 [Vespa velutina]XP_047353445.1 5-hydroxytryptamine receptor 2A isoform X1 [Vespa velutina]XP_047353446.1 5-hydroxytryptamine receptor 2A isoform X1 [Vespa velutina]XP_047353447.1 5-hydroxytryptamine receptor 2A isoform X1 [Vespa velutina]